MRSASIKLLLSFFVLNLLYAELKGIELFNKLSNDTLFVAVNILLLTAWMLYLYLTKDIFGVFKLEPLFVLLFFTLLVLIFIQMLPATNLIGSRKRLEFIGSLFFNILILITIGRERDFNIANGLVIAGGLMVSFSLINVARVGFDSRLLVGALSDDYQRLGRVSGLMILYPLFSSTENVKRQAIIFSLGIIGLLISVQRAPWVACILIYLITFLFRSRSISYLKQIVAPRNILVLLLLIAVISYSGAKARFNYVIERFASERSGLGSLSHGKSNERIYLYDKALDLIAQNLLSGVGFGNFSKSAKVVNRHPHNIFLELWVELGLFGMVLFALIVYLSIKRNKGSPVLIPFLYFLVNSQVGGDIVDNRIMWVLLLNLFIINRD